MYKFMKEKKEKILQGRTITYIAKKVGITVGYLSDVLNNKRNCSKMTAYCIVKSSFPNAEIKDFFERIK